jgi:hypothetical protein
MAPREFSEFSESTSSEQPIAGVAKSGQDVAVFVQLSI